MAELNRGEVMSRRFALDEQIAIIQGRHKAELEPLIEEKNMCEQYIKQTMLDAGEQQFKTAEGHMTFFTTKDSVKVGDWDGATLPFIIQNNAYHLLNQAVNKTAVKEYIEAHQTPPPGVEYVSFKDLSWRRGKG